MPSWFVKLYHAFIEGDLHTAQEYQFKINRVIDAILRFGKNGAIKGTKAVLELMGFNVGNAIFPATQYTNEEMKNLKDEMTLLGISF